MPRVFVAGFSFSLTERSWDAERWTNCAVKRVSDQKIWRRFCLRLPKLRSISRTSRAVMLQELHNLLSGRAFWATMFALTFLGGYSFIQAVDLYGQASRSAIEYPELARGMVPFEGILVPTLGALYLASTLLLPFVAIRAIAQDKESGALKLLLQMPITPVWLVALKVIVMVIRSEERRVGKECRSLAW